MLLKLVPMLITFNDVKPKIHPTAFVAPTASLIGAVELKEQASVWFACVLRGDINSITIGVKSNIQDGCILHVTDDLPVVVGDRVTCGHGAIIHGCTIEDDCLIAMGAIVLDGAVVGAGSVVGAGCTVAPGTIIPPNSLVLGTPGKVIRQVKPDDREKIDRGWQNYVEYSEIYKRQLSGSNI